MRHVEQLETRCLLSSFTASSVAELVADINAANAAGGSNTITLAAGTTFKLNAVADNAFGPTGLPVITAGDDLTILGNADTIQRSTGTGTPMFRLFDVATGGSLALNNLTLSNGLAVNSVSPYYLSPQGGAIRSEGTLSLNHVTVLNCTAQGQFGDSAYGGGIYSSGVLTVADSVIQNNQALGGSGYDQSIPRGTGGWAFGGGVFIGGGTASLTNTTLSSNLAQGGDGANGGRVRVIFTHQSFGVAGGAGGSGFGGAIYAGSGTIELRTTTITQNAAKAGTGGSSPKGLPKGADGVGRGGGLYIGAAALVSLDLFTQANTSSNTASTSDNDILGSFTALG